MNTDNPYEPPSDLPTASTQTRATAKVVGTVILLVGLAVLVYGAIAFWIVPSLPPNNISNGRLPSLYVMGLGILVAVVGLVARDLRSCRTRNGVSNQAKKEIPSSYGILLVIAVFILGLIFLLRL
jgi:peptidoglycan/LPS O-acetylase OafA/YrhL